jgi:hypothetical protein
MRKPLSFVLVALLCFTLVRSGPAKAEVPVKARAFLTMAGYGAGGGALLGLASMAFGNNVRAIAQGASLGLYAGLLFGTYVLVSHHQRQMGEYDDGSSPYQKANDIYGDEYNSEEGGGQDSEAGGGFFNRSQQMQDHVLRQSFTFASEKKRTNIPPITVNFFHYEF